VQASCHGSRTQGPATSGLQGVCIFNLRGNRGRVAWQLPSLCHTLPSQLALIPLQ
jgi:hypothetical protein